LKGCIPNLGSGTGGSYERYFFCRQREDYGAGDPRTQIWCFPTEFFTRKDYLPDCVRLSERRGLLDEAGVDVLLVGDSLAMVVLGYETTLPVTGRRGLLHHTRAVRRGTRHALLVSDMPYGSYPGDPMEAVRHAVRFVKEAGAEAVKVEGGERRSWI